MIQTVGAWWMWAGFLALVLVMLTVDMLALKSRGAHRVDAREALLWTLVWIGLALLFNLALWWYLGGTLGRDVADRKALEFLAGYLIEKSLAVDNVFVFLMVFKYFAVPAEYQRRVLVYGVLGAIVMRAVMILLGSVLITRFHWVIYLFGAFLVITGIKMLVFAGQEPDLTRNPVLRWMRGHLPITTEYHGERFTVMRDGRRVFTPLFLVLVLVEVTDLIFAVDSIPAIFAVTTDPFIVFTSNIFAILGLRAMYFLLADLAARFHLLKYGLAVILLFVGIKMLLIDIYKIPIGWALGAVFAILLTSVFASLWTSRSRAARAHHKQQGE